MKELCTALFSACVLMALVSVLMVGIPIGLTFVGVPLLTSFSAIAATSLVSMLVVLMRL